MPISSRIVFAFVVVVPPSFYNNYFVLKWDACGKWSFSSVQNDGGSPNAHIRCSPNSIDESMFKFQRALPLTLERFLRQVSDVYLTHYLRKPTTQDMSSDCSQWGSNGVSELRVEKLSIIWCSRDTSRSLQEYYNHTGGSSWPRHLILACIFRYVGFERLEHSRPVKCFRRADTWQSPQCKHFVNGHLYICYYLAADTYPKR